LKEYITYSRKAGASTKKALGADFGVSQMTALRAPLMPNYYRINPTYKPGLRNRIRAAQLAFAL
jgi:hypothetical protein